MPYTNANLPSVAGEVSANRPQEPGATLSTVEPTVGRITIRPKSIFDSSDPKEDRWIFRLANRLHKTTRETTIQNRLLFDTGDPYSPRLLEESERLLRAERFLRDARIRPSPAGQRSVDVEVTTQDVWTLDLGFSMERSGGANSHRFELQETNLMGTGRGLLVRHESDVDRSSSRIRYNDDDFLGRRLRLLALAADNSDGSALKLELGRPFYSLDSRWTTVVKYHDDNRIEALYSLGRITHRFRHRQSGFELYGGLSRGLRDGRARRWTAGLTYQRDRFEQVDGWPASPAPEGRLLAYPWIGVESIQDRYLEARDMQQISRTEDLHLGRTYRARLGFISPALGSDRSGAAFDFYGSAGLEPGRSQTLLLSAEGSGRRARGDLENLRIAASASYYWRNSRRNLFFAGLDGVLARNLDPENQVLLGGDSGLRGYPLRYQDGDRRLLLTLEQRFFTNFYPLQLFHVGAAVFLDAGRAWSGERSGAEISGWLRDVGIGLRLSPDRTGLGKMIHLDIAFPLDRTDGISSTQWLIRTRTSF